MTLSSILDSTFFRAVLTLAILPFIIHRISTFFFRRTARSQTTNKTPPTIPYYVPGVFHGVNILLQGPAAYFSSVIKEYGKFAPFVVKAGLSSALVIRDADHVAMILQANKQMTPKIQHLEYFDKVLNAPKETLKLLKAIGTGHKDSNDVEYAHLSIPRKHFSDASLMPLADVYISTLRRNLADKMFQDKTWTEIEDMWAFFHNEIARAIIETLLGSSLLKRYPRIARDLKKFDSNLENFTRRLPQFMMPKAYLARTRLVENLVNWLQSTHEGTDFANVGDEDPDWDADMGSKFYQATDSTFAKIGSLDYQARATEALAVLQRSTSNTVPSTLWHILETLRSETLMKRLCTEIRPHFDPGTGKYDVPTLTLNPTIQSMHAEIGRLRTATVVIRTNELDGFKLDENWSIPKGMNVIMFSHDLALNTDLWAKARPETVERPLDEFWPERFLIDGGTRRQRGQSEAGRFSMEGVAHLHITFGGGQHLCPGRYLAKAISVGTLAVLLNEYEIQLSDPDNVEQLVSPVDEVAYGTIKPSGQVRMRIRKRTTPKQTKAS